MTDEIKWSEWKIHTGGECPKEYSDAVSESRQHEAHWLHLDEAFVSSFAKAAPDNPIVYRYQLPPPKPVKTELFAVTFDSSGSIIALYDKSIDDCWKSLCIKHAKNYAGVVRFYDEDGNLTETHDFREVAS
jgi:hypothetical protein